MSISQTILQQLGGNKFLAMTGAKKLGTRGSNLYFTIGRNATSANKVTITLNGLDLYDIALERISLDKKTWDMKVKEIATASDIYAEDLQRTFTRLTGLDTHL